MTLFRFVAVTVLCLLLLAPMVKMEQQFVEKPVIILAQDNSESILTGKDSLYYKNEYPAALNAAIAQLSEQYEVVTYTFGDRVRNALDYSFTDKQTDISEVFDEIYARYYNRNVGAVILGTDGVYNRGFDPAYSIKSLSTVPLYAIALGDTSIRKDAMIPQVAYNRMAYLGNEFPLEIIVEANKLEGQDTKLTVSRGGEVLYTQDVSIDDDRFMSTVPIYLEADRVGLQRYLVTIDEIEGEVSVANNTYEVYIDVLDSRQKILLLANSPHPDIAAIKSSIKANRNYEVSTQLAADFDGNVNPYSLIVLHQLPSRAQSIAPVLEDIFSAHVPVLFVFGTQTNYDALNKLKLGVQVIGNRGGIDERKGAVNADFDLFTLNDELKRAIHTFPPLHVPFAEFKFGAGANVLFYQQKGTITTDIPLITFSEVEGTKVGIITGEGIWNWRTHNYSRTNSHDQYNELVSKIVQYMAAREDKSNFRVFTKNTFLENENVILEAEVYNDSYELINDPEVSVTLVDEEGKEYPYNFNRTDLAYRRDAGLLPPGNYTYKARVTLGEEEFTDSGEFSIKKLQVEYSDVIANHQLLYRISSENNGALYYPGQLDALVDQVKNAKEIVEISYTRKELSDLLNYKLIFFIVLLLLGAEWFMRKYNGAY